MRTNSESELIELTELYPYILPETPGVPVPLLEQEVLNVLRDFCDRTGAWRYILDRFNRVADQQEYTIDEWPEGARLKMIERVTTYDVESTDTDYTGTDSSLNDIKLDIDRQILIFLKKPEEDAVLAYEVEVSLLPGRTLTEVPTEFFDEYYSTLAKGVKAALMRMPGKRCTSPERGLQLESDYRLERGTVIETVKSQRHDQVNRPNKGLL